MSKINKIIWAIPINPNSVEGGGVGSYIKSMQFLNILRDIPYKIRYVNDINIFKAFLYILHDIFYCRNRKFLIHSVFNFYSLFLFFFPIKLDILLLPHGELTLEALELKPFKKRLVLRIIKILNKLNNSKINIIASNKKELETGQDLFEDNNIYLLQDIIHEKSLICPSNYIVPENKYNLVLISRLVENKGINKFLQVIIDSIKLNTNVDFVKGIKSIHFFVYIENKQEFRLLQILKKKILDISDIKIFLHLNKNHAYIRKKLMRLENKMPVIPSKFESFCYVIIETLNFEYLPLVWFKNNLVEELIKNRLCIYSKFGTLPTSVCKRKNQAKVIKFLKEKKTTSIDKFSKIINIFVSQ